MIVLDRGCWLWRQFFKAANHRPIKGLLIRSQELEMKYCKIDGSDTEALFLIRSAFAFGVWNFMLRSDRLMGSSLVPVIP